MIWTPEHNTALGSLTSEDGSLWKDEDEHDQLRNVPNLDTVMRAAARDAQLKCLAVMRHCYQGLDTCKDHGPTGS